MKEILTWLTSYREARFISSPFLISVIHISKLHFHIEPNLLIMISGYATPCLYRQTFCGTDNLPPVNHNVTLVGYSNTTTIQNSPFHDVRTEFDSVCVYCNYDFVISGFRRSGNEIFAILGCYAA